MARTITAPLMEWGAKTADPWAQRLLTEAPQASEFAVAATVGLIAVYTTDGRLRVKAESWARRRGSRQIKRLFNAAEARIHRLGEALEEVSLTGDIAVLRLLARERADLQGIVEVLRTREAYGGSATELEEELAELDEQAAVLALQVGSPLPESDESWWAPVVGL